MDSPLLTEATTDELLQELFERCEAIALAYTTKEQQARSGDYSCAFKGDAIMQSGLVDELLSHVRHRQHRALEGWYDRD